MTYIDIINHFWRQFENQGIKPNDALLYLYLVQVCNRKSWQNPFRLPNKSIVVMLELSEKSIIDSRRHLEERGLIRFSRGDRNCESPCYYLPVAKISNDDEEILKRFNLPTESCTADERHLNGSRTVADRKENGSRAEANQGRAYKEARAKTKETRHKDNRLPPDGGGNAARTVPTFEEIKNYFLSQGADKRIENWEDSARRFFDNFNAVGWIDKYQRRITRWDSRANEWIMSDEQKQKMKKPYGQYGYNRPGSSRIGVPIKGKIVPGCGLQRGDRNSPADRDVTMEWLNE